MSINVKKIFLVFAPSLFAFGCASVPTQEVTVANIAVTTVNCDPVLVRGSTFTFDMPKLGKASNITFSTKIDGEAYKRLTEVVLLVDTVRADACSRALQLPRAERIAYFQSQNPNWLSTLEALKLLLQKVDVAVASPKSDEGVTETIKADATSTQNAIRDLTVGTNTKG